MARIIGSKTAAAQYDALQEAEVSHFLLHVLDHPEQLTDHIRKYVFCKPIEVCLANAT